MESAIYQFGNGVKMFRATLFDSQIERYSKAGNPNLHEPVEEHWLLKLLETLPSESPTFLDVGAGYGYYSILIKLRRPGAKVFAVEPLPIHVQGLRETAVLNGLSADDIHVMQRAIGPMAGWVKFIPAGYASRMMSQGDSEEFIAAQAESLDEIVGQTGAVDVMKMDIQGAEESVLKAAEPVLAAGRISHIVLGTHSPRLHESCGRLLENAGYQILHSDPTPPMQPDGLIVAGRP